MSDELRSAAERYRKWGVGEFDYVSEDSRPMEMLNDDRRTLAEAYLAEHPADDAEPVTEEWLRSVGAEQHWNGVKFTFHREEGLPIGLWKVDDGWKAVLVYVPHGAMDIVRRQNTCGDVRRLCTALGIELKETGDA